MIWSVFFPESQQTFQFPKWRFLFKNLNLEEISYLHLTSINKTVSTLFRRKLVPFENFTSVLLTTKALKTNINTVTTKIRRVRLTVMHEKTHLLIRSKTTLKHGDYGKIRFKHVCRSTEFLKTYFSSFLFLPLSSLFWFWFFQLNVFCFTFGNKYVRLNFLETERKRLIKLQRRRSSPNLSQDFAYFG